MKDCKHLLTVYQGTHWDVGYTTVEQIKDIHRSTGFKNWGWLVAEMDGIVIGEIIFRIESNPISKKLGIIEDIGVDVRYQKKHGIGRSLVSAAEKVLREKNVSRVFITTPPEAYNFWMKVKYFARGSLQTLEIKPKSLPTKISKKVNTIRVDTSEKIPNAFFFVNKSTPGRMSTLLRKIVDEKKTGRLFEFETNSKKIGYGVIVKNDDGKAEFVADVNKRGTDFLDMVISRTAKVGVQLRASSVFTVIPTDSQETYLKLGKWTVNRYRDIPVTKLI